MDCTQAIRARRSIRKYQPGVSIPQKDVETMLEAAMMAPSARNIRPWEFFVVEAPELKSKLRHAHSFATMLDTAPLAIVVCAQPEKQTGVVAGYWPLWSTHRKLPWPPWYISGGRIPTHTNMYTCIYHTNRSGK